MKKQGIVKAKKICIFLLLGLSSLFLLSCATSFLANPDPPPQPLKIGWSLFPGWYPMAIALEQDLFAKHGVIVEPVFYDLYSITFADLQADKLDGALVTLSDALLMDARLPGNIRAVLITDNSTGADAIAATGNIKTVADLKGKHIGTNLGSFGELLVYTMLETNGLTAKDVMLVNVNPEEVPKAMPEVIQAGHVWEPFISEAVDRGYHIVFSSAETPGLISDLLVVRTAVTETRPDDVRAFIAAWFEAVEWWQSHPTEGNAIIAQVTGLNPEEISTEGVKLFDLEDNRRAFTPDTGANSLYSSGRINSDFLISTGGLSTAPDIERLLDASFLE